jgi:hypothetical protein
VIGVSPATLEFKNAARSQSYTGYLFASTTDNRLIISLAASGQIADWLKFQNDTFVLNTPEQKFPVYLDVPDNVPNGVYSGIIEVRSQPAQSGTGGTGMGLGAVIYIKTTVEVGGTEGVWFRVLRLAVSNAMEGQPITADITVKNNAQAPATPTIRIDVLSHDRQLNYASQLITDQTVEPLARKTITTRLHSTNMQPGLYLMHFNVQLAGQQYWDSTENFYITAKENPQTVKIEGTLRDAWIDNANITLGESITAKTLFQDTGDVPINARARIEVSKGDSIVETLYGPDQYLQPNEIANTTLVYKPQEAGEYTLKIWVEYSGTRTAVRQATVKVWSYSPPILGKDINFYYIAIPAVIVIIGWLIIYYKKYYVRED